MKNGKRPACAQPQVVQKSPMFFTCFAEDICRRVRCATKNGTVIELRASFVFIAASDPQFWGVRCVICRQRFAKHPLPFGARRALRLYREAEKQREAGRVQVEARRAVRKLLASGEINGKGAEALRLYAGLDSDQWRTCVKVAKMMNVSKQYVHQLLLAPKVALAHILGDRVPWN